MPVVLRLLRFVGLTCRNLGSFHLHSKLGIFSDFLVSGRELLGFSALVNELHVQFPYPGCREIPGASLVARSCFSSAGWHELEP